MSTDKTSPSIAKKHTLIAGSSIAVGAVLMTYMVLVESEPGAIPLLLIVVGIGWYVAGRVRTRPGRK